MRKCDALCVIAALTVGLLALPENLGLLAAVVLAAAVYRIVGSEIGPSRRDVSAKVGVLRSLTTRGR